MLGPSLRSKKKREYPPLPGGIRRLHHSLLSFKADSHTTVHGFVLLYSETSSHVKLRYKMSYKYVILGGGDGGGGGGGGEAVESCSIEIYTSLF